MFFQKMFLAKRIVNALKVVAEQQPDEVLVPVLRALIAVYDGDHMAFKQHLQEIKTQKNKAIQTRK